MKSKNKRFKLYCDPGHSWLAVKRKLLIELGIIDKVSNYSYERGATVYLEEDCDAGLFVNAWKEKHGVYPVYDERHTNYDSRIRKYDYFEVSYNDS